MTNDLRDLLASAATDTTPPDLAGRAVASARRRRQGRLAVAGSVAAVTALVAGAVVLGPLQQTGDEPRPQDVASLPAELPEPAGLPELKTGAMDAASAAYIVDDQLVLVDATSGGGVVWDGFTELMGLNTGGLDAGALRPYQARLSPDGTTALVAMRFESSQRLLGIRIAVLDVGTAESSVEDLQLSEPYAESAWLEYNLMAWAPDSKTAYCVCLGGGATDGELGLWRISLGDAPADSFYSLARAVVPSQISAGAAGLAGQISTSGAWRLLDDDWSVGSPLSADSFALSLGGPGGFAMTHRRTYVLAVEESDEPQMPSPLPAGPVSSLQALGEDFVLVSRPADAPSGEPAPPSPLLAHLLTLDADPRLLTTFPTGTTSTSFAADLAVIG